MQFEPQNDRLSVPTFAEARKRRGLEHRCLLAFVSGEPIFQLLIRFRLPAFYAFRGIAQNLILAFYSFLFFANDDLLLMVRPAAPDCSIALGQVLLVPLNPKP